jgi:PEP-CTERM motif
MKKLIILFTVGLLTRQIVQAQGTVYLSNLDQPSAGSLAVGSDSWLAAGFQTGNNADGYMLNSVQLAMTDASGNPSGFTVMLYNTAGGSFFGYPGSSLATLNGSANPSAAGIFDYTPASSLMLSPGTTYSIVLTAGTPIANGAYEWGWAYPSTSYNPSGTWGADGGELMSNSGSLFSWSFVASYYPQFAITATAIPEPDILGLFALGGLFLGLRRQHN